MVHSVLKSPHSSPTNPNGHSRNKSVSFATDVKITDGHSIKTMKAAFLSAPGQTHPGSENNSDEPLIRIPKRIHPDNENKKAKKRARKAKSEAKKEQQMDAFKVHPGLIYIQRFKDDREQWKFQKPKQNWILRNWADVKAVPDGKEGENQTNYDTYVAEYIKGLQSQPARDRILKEANDVLKLTEGDLLERRKNRAKVVLEALGHKVEETEGSATSTSEEDSEDSSSSSSESSSEDDSDDSD